MIGLRWSINQNGFMLFFEYKIENYVNMEGKSANKENSYANNDNKLKEAGL
jgi:hypothetical protein